MVGSCGLRELEAGEKRVWARKERPDGCAGTVGASGRTKQVTRMSVYEDPPPSVAMMWA